MMNDAKAKANMEQLFSNYKNPFEQGQAAAAAAVPSQAVPTMMLHTPNLLQPPGGPQLVNSPNLFNVQMSPNGLANDGWFNGLHATPPRPFLSMPLAPFPWPTHYSHPMQLQHQQLLNPLARTTMLQTTTPPEKPKLSSKRASLLAQVTNVALVDEHTESSSSVLPQLSSPQQQQLQPQETSSHKNQQQTKEFLFDTPSSSSLLSAPTSFHSTPTSASKSHPPQTTLKSNLDNSVLVSEKLTTIEPNQPISHQQQQPFSCQQSSRDLELLQSLIQSTKFNHDSANYTLAPATKVVSQTITSSASSIDDVSSTTLVASIKESRKLSKGLLDNSATNTTTPITCSNNEHFATPTSVGMQSKILAYLNGNAQIDLESSSSFVHQNQPNQAPLENSIGSSILASLQEQAQDQEFNASLDQCNELLIDDEFDVNTFVPEDMQTDEHIDIDVSSLKIAPDILDDLATRFILNMPDEEKNDPIRICFQIEIAYWFYTDFFCEAYPELPRLKLRRFANIMFKYIPRLRKFLGVFNDVIDKWMGYKFSVPCSGAVILDPTMEYVLLVQGFSRNWSFPKGKMNHDETMITCAIREVLEEIGYDCSKKIQENTYLERKVFDATCRLYLVYGVDMRFPFHPHARNEIRSIQWFSLSELPIKVQKANKNNENSNNGNGTTPNPFSKFSNVIPFVYSIRKWVAKERRKIRTEKRRIRKRNTSEGAGGGGSSGGSTDDQNDLSFSESPYTVVENSTNFVDNCAGDQEISSNSLLEQTQQQQQQQPLMEKSMHTYNVFQRSDTDPNSTTNNNNNDDCDIGQTWPRTWQMLVNAYNDMNGNEHKPIGFDLMETSSIGPSPTKEQMHKFPNVTKLEDVEAILVKPQPTEPASAGAAALPENNANKLNNLFANAFGSKEPSTKDKLSLLFSCASQQQNQVPQSVSSTNSSTINGLSSIAHTQSVIDSKLSPFGAIGSSSSKHSSNLSDKMPPTYIPTLMVDDNQSNAILKLLQSGSSSNSFSTTTPTTVASSSPSVAMSVSNALKSMLLNESPSQSSTLTKLSDATMVPLTSNQVKSVTKHYNGISDKSLPAIEEKISKLLECLKPFSC